MREKILESLIKNDGSRMTIHYVQSRNYIDWDELSTYPLPENFIREFSDKVNWRRISDCQTLSEDFIREFSDRVDWYRISYYQTLSKDFILEFADRVDWDGISLFQNLSENFIRKFSDRF